VNTFVRPNSGVNPKLKADLLGMSRCGNAPRSGKSLHCLPFQACRVFTNRFD
jgi:hypothetical protein